MKYIILSLFLAVGFVASPVAFAQTYYGYNRLPVFTSVPKNTAIAGQAYSSEVRAYDPDGDALIYELIQAPSGMGIKQANQAIVWNPTFSQAGSHAVTISVRDSSGIPVSQSFTLTVSRPATTAVTGTADAASSNTGAANTASTQPSQTQAKSNSSAFGLFGTKSAKSLEISDVVVTDGPKNIYNSVSNANCSVLISWRTNLASAGQVVYGTRSQLDIDRFVYEQAAVEGSSLQTSHSVALPSCLENTTYYFRVIAFTSDQRKVSEQMTILPFTIQTDPAQPILPVEGGASVFSAIGGALTSPFVIIVIIAVIVFLIVKRLRAGKSSGGHEAAGGHASAEPAINIPHR